MSELALPPGLGSGRQRAARGAPTAGAGPDLNNHHSFLPFSTVNCNPAPRPPRRPRGSAGIKRSRGYDNLAHLDLAATLGFVAPAAGGGWGGAGVSPHRQAKRWRGGAAGADSDGDAEAAAAGGGDGSDSTLLPRIMRVSSAPVLHGAWDMAELSLVLPVPPPESAAAASASSSSAWHRQAAAALPRAGLVIPL